MRPCKMGCVAQRPKELYKAHRVDRGGIVRDNTTHTEMSCEGHDHLKSHGLDNAMVPQRLDFRGIIDPLLSWRESVDRKKGRGGGECRGKQQVSRQGERAEAMELHMTDVDELLIKIAESERLRQGCGCDRGEKSSGVHGCCRGGQQRCGRETAAGNLRSEGSLLAMNREDGNEKSLLAALVRQEIAAGCDQFVAGRDQGRWQRKIAAGNVCAARERYWLRWQREIAADSIVHREIAADSIVHREIAADCDQVTAGCDQGRWQREITAGCDQGGWQREIAAGSVVQREIAAGCDQGRWQHFCSKRCVLQLKG
ncbi:hypothetical protein BHE74_00017672 [Ensete ventricosum]|nr:hypothetical protein BHE74_00017672 [Ensete ventricosum]